MFGVYDEMAVKCKPSIRLSIGAKGVRVIYYANFKCIIYQ
jgi:hypothetical protein